MCFTLPQSRTSYCKLLHWLLVKARTDYKILFITYKALHNLAPDYIKELLVEYKPSRSLRSSTQNLLAVPPTKSKTGAFQVAAPKLWNSMPSSIRLASSLTSFKSLVKTSLFKKCFPLIVDFKLLHILIVFYSLSFLCFYLLFDVRA